MKKGFTLLELIVVLVIIGILATLGLTQYARMVENMRGAEAREILGEMRKLAAAYRLANGTVNGMPNDALNIGTAADQIPPSADACRSSHYFRYANANPNLDPLVPLYAYRCTSGGKSPQGPVGTFCACLMTNLVTGQDTYNGTCCEAGPRY